MGCNAAGPPSTFGVNLTISLAAIPDTTRTSITQLQFDVSGDETYSTNALITKTLSENQVRVHYVPGIRSGTIAFKISGLASDGTAVAAGESGAIVVVDGRAVAALVSLTVLVPGSKNQGDACSGSIECASAGGCVDGVCCDVSCSDSCSTCSAPGSVGTCTPVASGSMPVHGTCSAEAASTCGHDGTCDGVGACRLYPQGTSCSVANCDTASNIFTPASQCDGAGTCTTLQAYDCAPYRCQNGSACFGPPCNDSTQCDGAHSCVGGSCGLLPNGRNCSQANQCQSGFCVDGVCCGSICRGNVKRATFQWSGLLGHAPQCMSGAPHSSHSACAGGGTVCVGTCNGSSANACSYSSAVCGASSCSATTETDQVCSSGSCTPTTKMCQSGFGCGGNVCATMCDVTTSAGCVANYFCGSAGSSCTKKILFGNVMSTAVGISNNFVLAADFDQNGKMDLAVSQGFDGGGIMIFMGQGDGTFIQKGGAIATGSTPIAIASADFNNDTKPDLAMVISTARRSGRGVGQRGGRNVYCETHRNGRK